MGNLTLLDNVLLTIMALMIARGLYIGLIREGFSIAALGSGLIAIRYGIEPASAVIENASAGRIGSTTSMWIAGALIGIVVVAAVASVGKFLRRGAHAVGLGFADRVGGGIVGAAEGALACAVILLGAIFVIGEDAPLIANSRSAELLEHLQRTLSQADLPLPPVATPKFWPRNT